MYFSYGYGLLTVKAKIPPYSLLKAAYDTLKDQSAHWRNDLGLTPTRHLVTVEPGSPVIKVLDGDKAAKGFKLVSGLTAGRTTLHGALLFDEKGTEVHFWPIDYSKLDPDGRDPENVYLHGIEIFEDGSIVVNFDDGNALAKISTCGDTVWLINGPFHHVVSKSFDGTIWTLEKSSDDSKDEFFVQIDPNNGEIIRRISLIQDVIRPNNAQGIFEIRMKNQEPKPQLLADPFHTNDIEFLDPKIASAFPLFDAGDILISLRNINLVAVIDGHSFATKWWSHGPWHRQHDPDFLSDGTISVFNNNMNYGKSDIVRINPQSGEIIVSIRGSEDLPFYTGIRGKHEVLENGNILITVSQSGRAFEVDPQGKKVWEFNNTYDIDRNGVINKVMQIPPGFFNEGIFDCNAVQTL